MSKDRFQDCQEIRIQDTEEVGYDTIGSERKTWWKIKEEEDGIKREDNARKERGRTRGSEGFATRLQRHVDHQSTFAKHSIEYIHAGQSFVNVSPPVIALVAQWLSHSGMVLYHRKVRCLTHRWG